jgi:hypothetical protein
MAYFFDPVTECRSIRIKKPQHAAADVALADSDLVSPVIERGTPLSANRPQRGRPIQLA